MLIWTISYCTSTLARQRRDGGFFGTLKVEFFPRARLVGWTAESSSGLSGTTSAGTGRAGSRRFPRGGPHRVRYDQGPQGAARAGRLGPSKEMSEPPLRPKGVESNNIYRGIDWIDEQYLKNPDGLAHLLPILGFSLRLLMETVAREYFASIGEDYGDRSLSKFVKDIVKPTITAKLDTTERNSLALASEWINGINTFEALLSKWAHGTLAVDRASLVQQSELAALIIDVLWT